MLTITLIKQLRDKLGKRLSARIEFDTDDPDWRRGLSDYQTYREAPLIRDGRLPHQTSDRGAGSPIYEPPILLLWRQEISETAGQAPVEPVLFSFAEPVSTRDYLSICDGLIVVVDPLTLPGARAMLHLRLAEPELDQGVPMRVISDVTETLRTEQNVANAKKIQVPVAIVFSKMDAFISAMEPNDPVVRTAPQLGAYAETDGRAVHERMLALLEQWSAQEMDIHMRLNYLNFRYFCVSALGTEPDHETQTVDVRGVRSHRVEDPALWLLSKTGAVPSV